MSGRRKSEQQAASSLSMENQLLADLQEEFNERDEDNERREEQQQQGEETTTTIDPFSTAQFQSKRRRGFRKKPRPFSEEDIEALQQLAAAKHFAKFHSKMKREAQNDESIGDHLKACALLATKLRHCKNEFIEHEDQEEGEEQITSYYQDRLEEYSSLSKQEFLSLAERYKSDIHHTIDKWLKKRSKSRSHLKKNSTNEFKRNMLSDALHALAKK